MMYISIVTAAASVEAHAIKTWDIDEPAITSR
jgi:hypothetical protein